MHFLESFHREIPLSGIVSFLVSLLIIKTQRWHGVHSHDSDDGPQKFHIHPTPRIGGIAILSALLVALVFASDPASHLLGLMLLAGTFSFASGLCEDITKRVSVSKRLLATMLSGFAAWMLTGYTITHLDIPGVDSLLLSLPFSVLFTAFAVAGVANAINVIDGFNGLASGTLILSFLSLGLIAYEVGDRTLVELCLTISVVIGGFMLFNFPFGKLFLGDGGAYLLGFLLACVAVMLPHRNPDVSPWASLLACAYPINETLFTIVRRLYRGDSLSLPDSLHLHSLVKIKIVRFHFTSLPPYMRNSAVAPFCWMYAGIVSSAGAVFYDHTQLLVVAWCGSFALYGIVYALLSRNKGCASA
ncbi:MAG: glycosyltransferase [Chlorobium sp.]